MKPERIAAFVAAKADPNAFLEKHFDIRQDSCPSCIIEVFKRFAAVTDKSVTSAVEATKLFVEEGRVEDFVLQAASAKVQDEYVDAAGP